MAYQSAREMLSRFPMKMAHGGPIHTASGEPLYGKGATAADLLAAEQRVLLEMEDPSTWDPATTYAAIMESGVSVQDALDAGVAQTTIDAIFTTPTALAGDQLSSQGQASFMDSGSAFADSITQAGVDAYKTKIMEDSEVSPEERREMQQIATEQGVTYQDMIGLGFDPNWLYDTPAPAAPTPCPTGFTRNAAGVCVEDVVAPTPCPTGYTRNAAGDCQENVTVCGDGYMLDPITGNCVPNNSIPNCGTGEKYNPATGQCEKIFTEVDTDTGTGADSATGVVVYNPENFGTDPTVFATGDPSLDTTFRESAPRTEVLDSYGNLTNFDYTPAAKLRSATGSGYNWTPPTVTGRPRSLMGADLLARYTGGRAAADLRQLTTGLGNGRTYSDYTGVLQNPGSYGGGLSKSQLYSRMRGLDYQRDAAAVADRAASTPRGGIAAYLAANPDIGASYESQKDRLGGQSLQQFARNHYNTTGKAEMVAGTRGLFTLVADTPVSINPMSTQEDAFNGGFGGFEGEGEGEGYETSNWNQRYDMGEAGGVYRPFAHGGSVKKPEGFADGGTASANLTNEELQAQLIALDAQAAPVEEPLDQEQTESSKMFDNLTSTPFTKEGDRSIFGSVLAGIPGAVESAIGYGKDVVTASSPSAKLLADIFVTGHAMRQSAEEDPLGYLGETLPPFAQVNALNQVDELNKQVNEARRNGNEEEAKRLEKFITVTALGAFPFIKGGVKPRTPGTAVARGTPELPLLEGELLPAGAGRTSSRELLDELSGNALPDTPLQLEGPAPRPEAPAPTLAPEVGEALKMLDEVDNLSKPKSFSSWDITSDPVEVFDEFGELTDVVDGPEYALIEKVYVDPSERGQGAARNLLRESIVEIQEKHPQLPIKLAASQLEEGTDLDRLVEFYESEGFISLPVEPGMDFIPMEYRGGKIDAATTEAAKMLDEVDSIPAPKSNLTKTETATLNKSAGKNETLRASANLAGENFKTNYPVDGGWAPVEITGVKFKNGNAKVTTKKIPYAFQNSPEGVSNDEWEQKLSTGLVDGVENIILRTKNGDQAALDIIAQANWYRTMRNQLRSEFGGIGDVFADVIGATSAQTNVEQNFNNSVDIIRKYSRGDYDLELEAFERRMDQGLKVDGKTLIQMHKAGEFPLITKDSGAMFNSNSPAAMGALLDIFRNIKAGKSPKTPNFTGNLIGLTNEATIDVWAGRKLRDLAGLPRIPPSAEQAVAGAHRVKSTLADPNVGSEFGFGQRVFRKAATELNKSGALKKVFPDLGDLGPDDLQAIVWFIEKEQWTKNGWTTKTGEGGSLDYEMSLLGSSEPSRIRELRREVNAGFKPPQQRKVETDSAYQLRTMDALKDFETGRDAAKAELESLSSTADRVVVGISGARPERPMSNYQQAELAAPLDDVVRDDPNVRGYGITSTQGLYMNEAERSLNAEFVVGKGFDPAPLRLRVLELGKEYNQDSVLFSKVVEEGAPNARPGVEIYFKEKLPEEAMSVIVNRLMERGVDGFTYITDSRFSDKINRQFRSGNQPDNAGITGIRFQYVPEFDESFDSQKATEMYKDKLDSFSDIVGDIILDETKLKIGKNSEVTLGGNVSDARIVHYDTEVFFRGDYDDYIAKHTRPDDSQTGGGRSGGSNNEKANRGSKEGAGPPRAVRDGVGGATSTKANEEITALNIYGYPLGINVAVDKNGTDYADLIVNGTKKFESRETPSLKPYVGKRVGIVRTGAGPAEVIGSVEIGQPIEVNQRDFNKLRDQHLVAEDSSFNIKKGQTKFLYPMINPTITAPQKVTSKGIVARAVPAAIPAQQALPKVDPSLPKVDPSLPKYGIDFDFPITHESSDNNFGGEILDTSGDLFDGVFGLGGLKGNSLGPGGSHHTYLPRMGKVADVGSRSLDYDMSVEFINKEFWFANEREKELLYEAIAEDVDLVSLADGQDNPLSGVLGMPNDIGDAAWFLQNYRGKMAVDQDFDAIAMSDENGVSYLVPFGSKSKYAGKNIESYDELEALRSIYDETINGKTLNDAIDYADRRLPNTPVAQQALPKYEGMRDATVQHLKNKGIMSQSEFDRAERDSFEKTGNWDSMPEPKAVYTIEDSGSNSSYVTIKKPKNYVEEGIGDPDEYTIRFSDHSLPKQYAYDQNIYNVSEDYYDETINGKTLNDAINYVDRLLPNTPVAQQGDINTILNISDDERKLWRKTKKETLNRPDGWTREPNKDLMLAAQNLGKIQPTTSKAMMEYAQEVQRISPIKLITQVPKLVSFEDIANTLDEKLHKKGIIGINRTIEEGEKVGARLHIPGYNAFNTWIVTVHKGTGQSGPVLGYGQLAVLDNVTFSSSPEAAYGIAATNKSKSTFARMNGKWRNVDPEVTVEEAKTYLKEALEANTNWNQVGTEIPNWIQVGMNPDKHSYFYNKSTGQPLGSANKIIQIGQLVLARGAVTRDLLADEHKLLTKKAEKGVKPTHFKKGGSIERVYNDRRYI